MTKEQERDSGQQIIELINMTLTDVPVDLHRAWNAVAASFGLGMKGALLGTLHYWITNASPEADGLVPFPLTRHEPRAPVRFVR